jgi:protein-disulfide isomerase
LIYFAFIAFLMMLGTIWATRIAFLINAVGAGISLALTAELFSSGAAFCVLCLLVHAANLILFVSLFIQISKHSASGEQPSVFSSWKTWAAAGLMIAATTGLLEPALSRPSVDTTKVVAEYRSAPMFDIPVDARDATVGPPNARARLVVFSSFQCHWCQVFAPSVHELNEHFGDSLAIVFKNYPLGKTCNPNLPGDMQPRACAAAWAAEAANRQKAFWRFHDGLFADSLDDSEEMLRATARGAGVDLERWDKERTSAAVQLKIASDVLVASRLGVGGTPTVFLNNRKVKNPSLPVLETLIAAELRQSK